MPARPRRSQVITNVCLTGAIGLCLAGLVALGWTVRVDGNFVCGTAVRVALFGLYEHGGEFDRKADPNIVNACEGRARSAFIIGSLFESGSVVLAGTAVIARRKGHARS